MRFQVFYSLGSESGCVHQTDVHSDCFPVLAQLAAFGRLEPRLRFWVFDTSTNTRQHYSVNSFGSNF